MPSSDRLVCTMGPVGRHFRSSSASAAGLTTEEKGIAVYICAIEGSAVRFARLRRIGIPYVRGSRALPGIGESTTLVSGLRDATLQHSEVVTMFRIVAPPLPTPLPTPRGMRCEESLVV